MPENLVCWGHFLQGKKGHKGLKGHKGQLLRSFRSFFETIYSVKMF